MPFYKSVLSENTLLVVSDDNVFESKIDNDLSDNKKNVSDINHISLNHICQTIKK